nr:carboxypeptidase regulatory-like domain-containing protein [Candidatus Brocadiales bacterium]
IDTAKRKGKWSVLKLSPRSARLFVKTEPAGVRIRVLNIGPKFYQGMKLKPGRYHVEVSVEGYRTKKMWIKLGAGDDRTINIRLVKLQVADTAVKQGRPEHKADTPSITSLPKRPTAGDSAPSLPPPPTW